MSLGVPPAIGPADLSLQEYLEILRRRRWIIMQTLAVVLAVGVVTTAMTTPIYRASGKLYVESAVSQINTVNSENPLVGLLALSQPDSVQTQIQLLKSGPFIEGVMKANGLPPEVKGIEPSIQVGALEGTNVIQLTVDAADPKQAQRLVNGMLDQHVLDARALSTRGVEETLPLLESETQKAKVALSDAEGALLGFRTKYRIPEMMAQSESRTRELVDLETRARENAATTAEKKALLDQSRRRLDAEPEEQKRFSTQPNGRRAAIQAHIDDLEYQREGLLQAYKPTHAKVRSIDGLLAEMRRQRDQEPAFLKIPGYKSNPRRERLEGEIASLEQDLKSLAVQAVVTQAQLQDRRRRVNDVGNWEIQLSALNRNRDVSQNAYLMLLGKLQDLRIRQKANRSFTRIVESAGIPFAPVRPRKAVNLLLASMAGLFFGVCMAFLQEFLDDRINSPEDADRLLGLPALAYIPLIPGERYRLITTLDPHSPITESYRGLRSSIMFSAIEAPLHTIMISSTAKGEGKSLTGVNLAIAMAYEGKRVILADADLRRPNVHNLLDLSQTPGLTDVLAGQAELSASLQSTSVPGLSVLTAGSIPPNPPELLNSEPMERLIDALRGCADVVVFDSPPCLPVTDAQMLSSKVDGVVLVVEMGEARKAAVQHAKRLFDQAHARTLGVVFNKLIERAGDSYYYYRRSYYTDEPKALRHTNGHTPSGRGHVAPALEPSAKEVSSPD